MTVWLILMGLPTLMTMLNCGGLYNPSVRSMPP